MPLYKIEKVDDSPGIGIWEITEAYDILLEEFGKPVEPEKPGRRKEWLAARLLVRHLTGFDFEILYDENGKPSLRDSEYHISISHTKQFVAVFISKDSIPGIDIEMIHPRIEKVSTRFLSENEKAYLQKEKLYEQLHVIWGTKECAFKIYSKGGIDFKNMLYVKPFEWNNEGKTEVILSKNNFISKYPAWWKKMNELIVVYARNKNF